MLDSVQFGSGELNNRLTIQEKDTTIVRIPIDFSYSGVGEAGRQLIQTGTVRYQIRGDLTVGTPIGNFTRPYTGSGRYTLTGSR